MADTAGAFPLDCLVIANPTAGTVTEGLVREVAARCGRHTRVSVVRTRAPGDAARAARDAVRGADRARTGEGVRVVVAVGGDGTVLEVVNGLMDGAGPGDRAALLVVPAGTGNSGYRSHWGTRPWEEAVDTALTGLPASLRRLDLARVRERDALVALGAGAGLTAEVLRSARQAPQRGRARLRAGLEHAAARFVPYPGRVSVDGTVVHEGETVLVNVGGGRHRAWQYLVLPQSELDDGLLDVCVVGSGTAPADVPALLLTGEHVDRPGVVYRTGRSVCVERTDGLPLCFEHDGELLADAGTRLTLDVLPGVLPVLCAPRPGPAAAKRQERAGSVSEPVR
ncbi:diacylglycerol kinase [Streptomyces sp. WAC07149]|uniref:diacylglycerol/lipid kinase family protein n=1 Tax=Streptomyces sp. WAC07149 TaxID=2487425 RepID=UPI000F7A40C3|nr:diacylglycerol kinase family protein [Streptomyces sp. WAC07149]RST06963.1 diacylglycerol kinase [Streptomyces sp. WAC07149]